MVRAPKRRWRRAATIATLAGVLVSAETARIAITDRDLGLGALALLAAWWSVPNAVRLMRRK
jgi:hypothetical protein